MTSAPAVLLGAQNRETSAFEADQKTGLDWSRYYEQFLLIAKLAAAHVAGKHTWGVYQGGTVTSQDFALDEPVLATASAVPVPVAQASISDDEGLSDDYLPRTPLSSQPIILNVTVMGKGQVEFNDTDYLDYDL